MLGRDRGKRGKRNKDTEQVVFYPVSPFGGSHPKQGCGRVACEDLEKKKKSVKEVVAHVCSGNGE